MLPPLSAPLPADAAARLAAEQEVENLSGLSPNPEKDIFVVRENRTTCLMAEFAAKFLVPYDVWASNYVDLITEQADIPLSRGAEMKGKCGTNESELEISWLEQAYTLKLFFLKEGHNTSRGQEAFWRLGRIQFAYDTSERTYFKDAVSRKRPDRDLKAQPRGDSRSRDFKAHPRGMPSVGAAKRNLTGKTSTPHPPDRLGPGAVFKPYVHFYVFPPLFILYSCF